MIHMTPGYFKATREDLGLPVAWLARRWKVRRQSVDRWESGERSIPDTIARDLQSLDAYTRGIIQEQVNENEGTLTVPQGAGEEDDDMPASWHRMVAKRVAEQTGAKVLYEGQEEPEDDDMRPAMRQDPDQEIMDYVHDWDQADPGWRHHLPDSMIPVREISDILKEPGQNMDSMQVLQTLMEAVADWEELTEDMREAVCSGSYRYKDVTVLPNRGVIDVSDPQSPARHTTWPDDPHWTLTLSTPDRQWPPEAEVVHQDEADSWQEAMARVVETQADYEQRTADRKRRKRDAHERLIVQESRDAATLDTLLREAIDRQTDMWERLYHDGQGRAHALDCAQSRLADMTRRVAAEKDQLSSPAKKASPDTRVAPLD
ncbi:hypothetical protein J3U01_01745 [Bifidobacterium sp. B4107]|uniref:hypothetical protein n=1 Tax=unclassified Bifidobacterium TaxID=2608897 RepID=UPI00226B3475|nr:MULTISPECIES: hypothetical protein [unclassified Bifidobacterium]MCX8647145.1 hypothetical protein [Bifidobacterium sp. B4107]MCX8651325.1 hypothetical protein [Bifidobacterium sp. B4111]MCX8657755.1 hypothetical protein [Bifidobacterium sp. B4114]